MSLLSGDTVRVSFVVGSPPGGVAPIFSIYDDQQQEILLLAAHGDALVLRLRRLAADLRLESPELRWEDALEGVNPGDTVNVGAWRTPGSWPSGRARLCLGVDSRGVCAAPDFGHGWVLL